MAGIFIPFAGTVLGAALVFFSKKSVGFFTELAIRGISSGVMVAASVWSLLIPATELSRKRGSDPLLLTCLGFLFGVGIFTVCEKLLNGKSREGSAARRYQKSFLPCVAVALHNFPEGMAVGAVFAEVMLFGDPASLSAAMALSIGIAVQNLPEGAIVSMPLYSEGLKKSRSFLLGAASGVVEPIGAIMTIIAAEIAVPMLPFLLAAAAGAMIFAVLDCIFQLERQRSGAAKPIFSLCFSTGFVIMMSLDVLLG